MLFVDSKHVTVEQLRVLEPELDAVAEEAEIVLEGVSDDIVRQAWGECANRIEARVDGEVRLDQIVATAAIAAPSALQSWLAYETLVLIFRAATARVVNDRYERKLERYEQDAKRAWSALWSRGLGIVNYPLPCPGATFVRGAGEWGEADLVDVAGGAVAATRVRVAITWWDQRNDRESGPSVVLTHDVPAAHTVRLSIARLVPPAGAEYWNIYTCPEGGVLGCVVAATPVATLTVDLAAPFVDSDGARMGIGQAADRTYYMQNLVLRG
jgi:hypothetical protein